MSFVVVNGAQLQCTMGAASSSLSVLPVNMTSNDNQPVASVQDYLPNVNIAPFAMCKSPANPQVAAATAAALGVLTPQPCVPATTSPWVPGNPLITLNSLTVLTDDSTCMCMWAGTISVTNAGTTNVTEQ